MSPPALVGLVSALAGIGMLTYAGIGSRRTPDKIQDIMTKAAVYLARKGYTLRSGHADGADIAFETGALRIYTNEGGPYPEIYRAEDATVQAIQMASRIHPNWSACSHYARQLHGRNCFQILGKNLDDPVRFVLCWTPNADPVGGTRTAIVLAEQWNIPVLNLANQAHLERVLDKLDNLPF